MEVKIPWEKWSSQPWLQDRTILLTVHGSHAYGLSRPTSDIDVKGICIAPRSFSDGFLHHFDQAESKDPDMVIMELRKFCALAVEGNPNILEILFTDPKHWLKTGPGFLSLYEKRDLLLSTKVRHTFAGYARSQLKKMISHHRYLQNPPTAPPTRAEFDLPERSTIPRDQREATESLIRKQIDTWSIDLTPLEPALRQALKDQIQDMFTELGLAADEKLWRAAGRHIGIDDNLMEIVERERRYRTKLTEWTQFQNWKATRNAKRYELEAKFGYDSKNAMHLVRLLRMAKEILSTGKVLVERPDREELLAIRDGAWAYEDLITWTQLQEEEIEKLYRTSTLPREPDRNALDLLCQKLVQSLP